MPKPHRSFPDVHVTSQNDFQHGAQLPGHVEIGQWNCLQQWFGKLTHYEPLQHIIYARWYILLKVQPQLFLFVWPGILRNRTIRFFGVINLTGKFGFENSLCKYFCTRGRRGGKEEKTPGCFQLIN